MAELGFHFFFLMCVHGGEVGVNWATGVQGSGRHLPVGSGPKLTVLVD